MTRLEPNELSQALTDAPGWDLSNGKLEREWSFPDFLQAMTFVKRVAQLAEAAGHHPDIDIRYNKVKLGLVTHDAGGITHKDVEMAARLGRDI